MLTRKAFPKNKSVVWVEKQKEGSYLKSEPTYIYESFYMDGRWLSENGLWTDVKPNFWFDEKPKSMQYLELSSLKKEIMKKDENKLIEKNPKNNIVVWGAYYKTNDLEIGSDLFYEKVYFDEKDFSWINHETGEIESSPLDWYNQHPHSESLTLNTIEEKKIPIEELFTYHPPKTDKRKQDHEELNEAAKAFALVLSKHLKDSSKMQAALDDIQKWRMLGNQDITLTSLGY